VKPQNLSCILAEIRTHLQCGRAIAQAVSRRLPTAGTRVRARVKSCGIRGRQSGTGAGFLLVLRFPLPILIPPTAPHTSTSIIRPGQLVADIPIGLSLIPPQKLGEKKSTALRQSVCLSDKPLSPTTSNFIFQLNTCGYSPYVTS
jgi:hypothetical protein